MIKKLMALILVIICSCTHKSTLSEYKLFYFHFIVSDTGVTRQAIESGLGDKIYYAPTRDSVDYYISLFSKYNDSVLKSRPQAKN
jgi:hypothetical protein